MLVHSYPLLLSLYKGEGRILIVPLIDHVAGYSIDAEWYENISDTDNAKNVGNGVLRAVAYIRNSPLSSLTPKEREDNQYMIHSMKKSEKRQGSYNEIIKEVVLPIESSAEKIGEAVIDVFEESEKFS